MQINIAFAYRKTIKYFYLDERVLKRLDKGIHVVNTYIRDKIVERMIKQVKGKNTSRIGDIEKRHEAELYSRNT